MLIRSVICLFLSVNGQDFLGRLARLPLSSTQAITGSYESIFGGLNIPRDSRLYSAFVRLTSAAPLIGLAGGGDAPPLTSAQEYFMLNSPSNKRNCTGFTGPINKIDDIKGWSESQLACLLRSSKAPEKLNTGLYYGRIESWLGSDLLRDFGEAFSGGTILANTRCDGLCVTDQRDCSDRVKIGFTQTGLAASAPSFNYLGSEQLGGWSLYSHENIKGDWWWMDWSLDMSKVCPSRVHRFYDSFSSAGDWFGRLNNIQLVS